VVVLGAIVLALLVGCGGGRLAEGDAARAGSASDDAAKGTLAGRGGGRTKPPAGTVGSFQEVFGPRRAGDRVHSAKLILDRYARKLVEKGLDDHDFRHLVCEAIDLARGTPVEDLAVGALAPHPLQLQAAINEIQQALGDGDLVDAFLSTACIV
jgi:hypothetical protein